MGVGMGIPLGKSGHGFQGAQPVDQYGFQAVHGPAYTTTAPNAQGKTPFYPFLGRDNHSRKTPSAPGLEGGTL